jgi:6-phosphogluconate dehydrogenase
METGFIGLGRLGANMVRRLLRDGHRVIVWNRTIARMQELVCEGAHVSYSIPELVAKLQPPRTIWLVVPAGHVTNDLIQQIVPLLNKSDILIDGGNTNYKESQQRSQHFATRGIHFMDAGIIGGAWGLKAGYCVTIGGEHSAFEHIEPLLKTLAPEGGYLHCGPAGAGHFARMVHNGIEYGLMEAYGEGFELLKASQFHFDLQAVAQTWNRGSSIRSWLLELASNALAKDPNLTHASGYVEDLGEGCSVIQQAMDTDVPIPVITLALLEHFRSQQDESFREKVVLSMCKEFGNYTVKTDNK